MMEPQPSTSAGTTKAAPSSSGGTPTAADGVQIDVVASTSGSLSPPPVHQQQQEEQLLYNFRASKKQMHQLFASSCRLNLQRCDAAPTGTVSDLRTTRKVDDESDTEGSSSSDEIKELSPPPTQSAKQNGSAGGTKKKRGKRIDVAPYPAHCNKCKKTFKSKYYLKDHMRRHTGKERYQCENCKRSFWNPRTFKTHKKKMTERNGVCPRVKKWSGGWRPKGSWTCKICGKRLKSPDYYSVHMRIHRGEKPFKCADCGKGFAANSDLLKHSRVHTGVMQHICVFCDKGFHRRDGYWAHLRVHTEERPYFCVVEDCGTSVKSLYRLKYHRRMVHLKKY